MTLRRHFFLVFFLVSIALTPHALAACGDGSVLDGDECDDGGLNGTTYSCCNTECKFKDKDTIKPNVIVGDLTGTMRHGTVDGISAYSFGTVSCNLGSCWLKWIASTPEHPVIGQNLYRLRNGRFEHIGQSWLKHGFTALAGTLCGACSNPQTGTRLGVNCSDPYGPGLNGTQTSLGPKVDVNPETGVFPYPDSRIGTTGNDIFKRLQVHDVDINPALNGGALYFAEGQYVTRDDATANNHDNNASYRRATFTGTTTFTMNLTDTTQQQKAGIQAWKATDPSVTEVVVDAPDGRFILSAKATAQGGGVWHYEYALQNLNNHRAAQSFTVPFPQGATVFNVGFHDVDYHSGEPFSGTDWTSTVTTSSVNWSTQPYAVNQNANALRWGTLYNFRFDANVAPGSSSISIGLFRPGTPPSISATTVTPGPCGGAPNGTSCSDFDACTLTDTCSGGFCVGSTPVVCTPLDACHNAGSCNPTTGVCSNPNKPDGTPCSDGDACTQTDGCVAGTCTGANPIVCAPTGPCRETGTCDAGTGACSDPVSPDGTPCSDGDACTQVDGCAGGVCLGGSPVVCTPIDDCHEAGTCDSGTGSCSTPAKPDGSPCDDANTCTTDDACAEGVCTGTGTGLPQDIGNAVTLSQAAGITTISWTPAVDSSSSSVLRGLVAQLPVGPGGVDEICLASNIAETSTTDAEDPPADQAFWYLVRGGSVCGVGPYGHEAAGGVATGPRESATCP